MELLLDDEDALDLTLESPPPYTEERFIAELVGSSTMIGGLEANAITSNSRRNRGAPDALTVSRTMFNDRLKDLVELGYTSWGATECVPLPQQNGREVDIPLLARQAMRAVTSTQVRRHEDFLLRVFHTSQRARRFICDAFWYVFLEHFALLDGRRLMRKYVGQVKDDIKKEQEAWVFRTIEKANQQANIPRTRSNVSDEDAEGSVKGGDSRTFGQRDKLRLRLKQHKKREKKRLKEHIKNTKDFDARWMDWEKPLHVIDAKEALNMRCPRNVDVRGRSEFRQSMPSSRATSAMSNASMSSMGTVVSLPETEMNWGQEEMDLILSSDRFRVHSHNYEGTAHRNAVLRMLLESEDITMNEIQAAKECPQGLEGSDKKWKDKAVQMIRMEQDRMFSRMSKEYTELFWSLTRHQKDAWVASFPELLTRMICQAMYRFAPYSREFLSKNTRKLIKRRFTYWVHGVENNDVANAEDFEFGEHARLKDEGDLGKQISKLSVGSSPVSKMKSAFHSVASLALSPRAPASSESKKAPSTPQGARTPRPPPARQQSGANLRNIGGGELGSPRATSESFKQQQQPGDGKSGVAQWATSRAPVKSIVHTFGDKGAVTVQLQELAYAEGLAEIRKAFDVVRAGTGSRKSVADGMNPPGEDDEAARERFQRKYARDNNRHVLYHRFAPINKKRALWHEQGRGGTQAVVARGPKRLFSLKAVSPLLKRFMDDREMDSALGQGPASLMSWSL